MIVDELKEKQPIDGKWYISKSLPDEGVWRVFTVNDALGRTAKLKTVILPDKIMVNEYENMYGKSAHTNDLIIEDIEKQIDIFFETLKKVQNLQNDFFVKIYDFGKFIFSEGYCVYEITENAACIDDYFSQTRLNTGMALKVGEDISKALSVCEDNNLIHGFVKYDNIFTDCNGTYKLGNFGIDILFENIRLKSKDTDYSAAPEKISDGVCNILTDIYSLGLVLYQLFNFKRLPFMPSKKDCYVMPDRAWEQAYQKRMSGEKISAPLYANERISNIICKCCSFEASERYRSASDVSKDIKSAIHSENITEVIDYPSFSAFGTKQKQTENEFAAINGSNENVRINNIQYKSQEDSGSVTPKERDGDENIYTMGAQSYYTEALGSIRNNRKIQFDDSNMQNIDEVAQKIAEKYGYESKEFKKFTEKLKTFEDVKENNEVLRKGNKTRTNIIKILCGVAALAVIAGIVLLLNSTTYYINQGQFNRIYKKTFIGASECFKQVSVENLIKKGSNLYYINQDDRKIYRSSVKNGVDEDVICEDSVKMFKIVDKYIIYINSGNSDKLYRIGIDGGGSECIYDGSCTNISVDKSNIEFITAEEPPKTMILNTDDLSVKEKIID